MRILALVHRVPYPPNKGEKIRAYQELKHLADFGHEVNLLTFADVAEDRHWRGALEEFCRRAQIFNKRPKLGRIRSVTALPRGLPLSVGYFHSNRFAFTTRRWIRQRKYDVVFCYSSPMAEFVRHIDIPKVMDFVDVDSDKWRQYAERVSQPMASVYALEARLLARYERQIAEEFDASILVSAAEADAFRAVAPKARRVEGVPNGVDADFFGETVRTPEPAERPLFVFVGQMDYFANVDAVKWFAEDVFPQIRQRRPAARFRIVGRAPTTEVQALDKLRGVEVTGGVPDVRDHLAEATVMVAPLRIARGIQNKVLEAMAARVPVVCAPNAFEGIEGQDGVHALVQSDAGGFADAVLELTDSTERSGELVAAARTLVQQRYAWKPAIERLESILLDAAGHG